MLATRGVDYTITIINLEYLTIERVSTVSQRECGLCDKPPVDTCISCGTHLCAACDRKPEAIAHCRKRLSCQAEVLTRAPKLLTDHSKFCFNAACPNLFDVVAKKMKLQACAGCERVSYCSTECQTIAWKGGHKDTCKKLVRS